VYDESNPNKAGGSLSFVRLFKWCEYSKNKKKWSVCGCNPHAKKKRNLSQCDSKLDVMLNVLSETVSRLKKKGRGGK
jgi:hypothetical protein